METNFFKQVLPFLNNNELTLVISKDQHDMIEVVAHVKVTGKKKYALPPLNMDGTAEEFDATFFASLQKETEPIREGLVSNPGILKEAVETIQTEQAKEEKKPKAPATPKKKSPAKKKSVSKKPAPKPAGKKKAKPSGSSNKPLKEQVTEAIERNQLGKAQMIVNRADKGGGMAKVKVAELQAMVDKAKGKPAVEAKTTVKADTAVAKDGVGPKKPSVAYYSPDEQTQLHTRLESLLNDTKDEGGFVQRILDKGGSETISKEQAEKMKEANTTKQHGILNRIALLKKKKYGLSDNGLHPFKDVLMNPLNY